MEHRLFPLSGHSFLPSQVLKSLHSSDGYTCLSDQVKAPMRALSPSITPSWFYNNCKVVLLGDWTITVCLSQQTLISRWRGLCPLLLSTLSIWPSTEIALRGTQPTTCWLTAQMTIKRHLFQITLSNEVSKYI